MTEMTPKIIKTICRDLGLYTTPEINDKLYLHYKGWSKIQNLEPYTGVKVLYMEGNGLTQIEGLDTMTELRSLYLQENSFTSISHLSHLTNLDTLNLNQNHITSISGLSNLNKLNTLLLQKNKLSDVEEMKGLLECPSIACLDLSYNRITDPAILDLLVQLPNLKVLYLKDNDVVQNIKNYRRTVISKLKNLTYLDERPIDKNERAAIEAWSIGGVEAEKAERERQRVAESERDQRNFEAFERMCQEARQEKAERQEKALADTYTQNTDTITTQARIQVLDDEDEPSSSTEEKEEKVQSDSDDDEMPQLEDVFITKTRVTESTTTAAPVTSPSAVPVPAPVPASTARPASPEDDGYVKEVKQGHEETQQHNHEDVVANSDVDADAPQPLADVNEISLSFHDEMVDAATTGLLAADDPLNDLD